MSMGHRVPEMFEPGWFRSPSQALLCGAVVLVVFVPWCWGLVAMIRWVVSL